ncbi:PIG-L family deacetylase [Ferroacidibacillus organovorans]|uniref:LmbE family protein n=1 Tax=Ferroacidibacillus organovorans TaxID=1765683 RepID=A0A853KGB2_9BACL|nr:PIG-L family deacetylase [Ferroacidibacillus organovorans]KYP80839.1 hypothetical protein AYJ22_01385 [Ferroacidibacillus organovorans]OAG95384.1 hypothetical protein AYW79_00265 [Ferroacidibacillus organovorans]
MNREKVIAVFAHPDDETFICGGILARYAALGADVTLVCATLGEMGRRMGVPPIGDRESIGAIRQRELEEAARALNLSRVKLLGYRDKTLEIIPRTELVSRLDAIFEEIEPTVVLTFHPERGGHNDHCAIGEAATEAAERWFQKNASLALYYITFANGEKRQETFRAMQLNHEAHDVSAYLQQKLEAFRAHRTQSGLHRALWGSAKQAKQSLSATEFVWRVSFSPHSKV